MKVSKHAKAIALVRKTSSVSKQVEVLLVSNSAISRAENFLARSQNEFVAKVEGAKKMLIKNEVGILAGKKKSTLR